MRFIFIMCAFAALGAVVVVVRVWSDTALAAPPTVQQAKLTAANGAGGDKFGNSVAISGDTAVVGG